MKELSSCVFHIIFIFIIANLIQFLIEYFDTQSIFLGVNITYEIFYVFISLLWGISIFIEFSQEFSKALNGTLRIIIHFILGYFGMMVGMLTFYGIDSLKNMFTLTTMVYIVSFVVCAGIMAVLVKKMQNRNFN